MMKKSELEAERSVAAEPGSIQLARPTGVNERSRRRRIWGIGGTTLSAALALCVFGGRDARSQVPPLQIIALAPGTNNDKSFNLEGKGPTDVLQTELVFQAGAETGWHYHPGPVVVVIKSGSLTEIEDDGCVIVHPAGSVFFEKKDVVHNAVNETGGVTDVYATFLSPSGAQPLIPAANPGRVCRPGRHND
jgi:quercetin dioxygenase-like cupin family protein